MQERKFLPELVKVISSLLITLTFGMFGAFGASAGSAYEATPSAERGRVLGTTPKPDQVLRLRIAETYGKLPLSFEANRGQSDGQVKFLARGPGQTFFFTSTELVLVLPMRQHIAHDRAAESELKPQQAAASVLRMTFSGANPTPDVIGLDELPSKANYFIGNDATKWRTDVPRFAKVRYRGLYPGIDLLYYGNQQQLEYDFVVQAGADPARIVLRFRGTDRLEVDSDGDLVLHTAAGTIRQRKPMIYQDVEGGRRRIAGHYVLKSSDEVGFVVAPYDHNHALVIDPVLAYSSYVGGNGLENDAGIAVDASGSVYMTGLTTSTDFPVTTGPLDATHNGGFFDVFVTKLNPAGAGTADLVYSTYLGGSGDDHGFGIAVDATGNAYVTGLTVSTDFPTTSGAFDRTLGGGRDAFVTKLNAAGNGLAYSTYLGGNGQEYGSHRSFSSYTRWGGGIAVDTAGNAYVTGQTNSGDFPTTTGAFDTAFNGGFSDGFVTKLNATGTGLVYSTYLGGNSSEWGSGIAVDGSGSAYITGFTISTNFPTTAGAFQTTLRGFPDVFVTKLNPQGTGLVYSTYLGGSGSNNDGTGIAVDGSGSAYVTGITSSLNFPTTAGAFQTARRGFTDVFVTKLNPQGTGLVYSTYLGGSSQEIAFGIALDGARNAYVVGFTFSTDFPILNAIQDTLAGNSDVFITKLNPLGTGLVYSTYLGGTAHEESAAIAVDAFGNAYVSGITASTDFPTTAGAFQQTHSGGFFDMIIVRISDTPPLESVAAELEALINAHPGTPLADKLEDALTSVQAAIAKLDQTPPDRQAAMGEIEGAIGDLEAAVKDGLLSASQGNGLMNRLAGAARLLAQTAIDEAIARSGDPGKINEAEQALADGDAHRTAGAFKNAVNRYKDALAKAEGA